jgi:putative SOS response-associated peptidase YedK
MVLASKPVASVMRFAARPVGAHSRRPVPFAVRMPLILAPGDYARWLGEEPDPRDLMRPFPADLMRMWPISTRVNKPENDDASILEPIEPATDAA